MIYVVYKNQRNEILLERHEDRLWELLKNIVKGIIYVSRDVADPEFNKYGIKTIVWDRFFNPYNHTKERIIIPYTPDNIDKMQAEAEKELKKKEQAFCQWEKRNLELKEEKYILSIPKRLENKREKVINILENDKLFEEEMSQYEILCKWKDLDYLSPPPTKIVKIKQEYNLSWKQFKELVDKLCK